MENSKDVAWFEFLPLAAHILGIREQYEECEISDDDVERAFYDKYEITMEHFEQVARLLMPLAMSARSLISDTAYTGFVVPGTDEWIVKTKLEEE